MHVNASQAFRELDEKNWKPFYLVVGDEPFQAAEIATRLKAFFIQNENDSMFNYESWDGEHLDAAGLLSSLDTMPGLFDSGDALRLVSCSRFDKVSPSSLETLEGYFKNPSPTTCFLIFAAKVDKRKAWYKALDERGYVIEINEPYDREWPKWQSYFERKVQKKIANDAWERIVDGANRSLSLVWAELTKLALYIGDRPTITMEDWTALGTANGSDDVFAFADDVLCGRAYDGMRRLQTLLRSGENEIKLLSILVRQFRMVEAAREAKAEGIADNKALASRIGSHPFFVSKVLGQLRFHTVESLRKALHLLAECDYRLKTGEGSLFQDFLLPYFGSK